MPRIGAIALVVFALVGRAGAAWECRTEHFRVISEPGPEVAQAAARHLEAVRQRFVSLGLPRPEEGGGPIVVLLFVDGLSLHPYAPADSRAPALTRGLSLAGEEQKWIAVAWEAPGSPLAALAHEYAHLARQDSSDPLWFREGLAEYVAGLPVSATAAGPGRAAAHHLRSLREQAWSGWEEFLAADRMSAAFARPNFYSQAWLAVHWLVARGKDPARLHPADLESLLRSGGSEWLDAQLRAYVEQLWLKVLPAPDRGEQDLAESAGLVQLLEVRPAEGWELPYWKAEFHRELDHREQAQPVFESLEREFPEVPEPSAALGALAMAQGRYELAEEKLAAAVRKGSRAPSTHHRYSLMLLRPLNGREAVAERAPRTDGPEEAAWAAGGANAADRLGRAVGHARQAREGDPDEPRYLLGEAQALLVAGLWDPAARLLRELQRFPGWGGRCEVEFAELLRRRQQAMRSVPAPGMAAEMRSPPAADAPVSMLVAAWLSAAVPGVPRPRTPARAEPKLTWPPPGTVLLYGYISGVECRGSEKIVSVRTPRFTIALRERAASPAKLYHPPSGWTELPCGLRGREVNVVYRPLPPGGEVLGELVAVVF